MLPHDDQHVAADWVRKFEEPLQGRVPMGRFLYRGEFVTQQEWLSPEQAAAYLGLQPGFLKAAH